MSNLEDAMAPLTAILSTVPLPTWSGSWFGVSNPVSPDDPVIILVARACSSNPTLYGIGLACGQNNGQNNFGAIELETALAAVKYWSEVYEKDRMYSFLIYSDITHGSTC